MKIKSDAAYCPGIKIMLCSCVFESLCVNIAEQQATATYT